MHSKAYDGTQQSVRTKHSGVLRITVVLAISYRIDVFDGWKIRTFDVLLYLPSDSSAQRVSTAKKERGNRKQRPLRTNTQNVRRRKLI